MHGDVLQPGTPSLGHLWTAQRMLLPGPCSPNAQLSVRVTVATTSGPTQTAALSIVMLPKVAGGFRARQDAERDPLSSVGPFWVLDMEGLMAGTLSDAALSPVPSPHMHLSAPRSNPASKE